MEKKIAYVIANFGGPRSLEEIKPFLTELLTDRDVIRTRLPGWVQNLLFTRIAKKRAKAIAKDYELIGGKSPIFDDTEEVAKQLTSHIDGTILTYHRYLPSTHADFIQKLKTLQCDEIRLFPMFPQFTYGTTGSIARWLQNNLSKEITTKMRWIKSYAGHPRFISDYQRITRKFIEENHLKEEECVLLFSAHGVPQSFITEGDIYLDECNYSFEGVKKAFPKSLCRLSFQSQFGKEVWIKPYTEEVCENILDWHEGRPNILFIPIAFTSDHIETLFEVEELYMTLIREKGMNAYRVPALNLDSGWIETIATLLKGSDFCNNQMLIR